MTDHGFLFDDAAMRDFLVNGYCVLKVDLPRGVPPGNLRKNT